MIKDNGYIQRNLVINFLQNGCIADYELIAEIYNNGMGLMDYQNLQTALDELKEEA